MWGAILADDRDLESQGSELRIELSVGLSISARSPWSLNGINPSKRRNPNGLPKLVKWANALDWPDPLPPP